MKLSRSLQWLKRRPRLEKLHQIQNGGDLGHSSAVPLLVSRQQLRQRNIETAAIPLLA